MSKLQPSPEKYRYPMKNYCIKSSLFLAMFAYQMEGLNIATLVQDRHRPLD